MTQRFLPVVLVVLCCVTPGVSQDKELQPTEIKELLQKGGKEWKSLARALVGPRGKQVTMSSGSRFWIHPVDDQVLKIRESMLSFKLKWQLAPKQKPLAKDERVFVYIGLFQFSQFETVFLSELDNTADHGTFEVSAGTVKTQISSGLREVKFAARSGKITRITVQESSKLLVLGKAPLVVCLASPPSNQAQVRTPPLSNIVQLQIE